MNNKNTILTQYMHEYATWERMLDYYKQENSYLKTRLADVLEYKGGSEFLAQAEHFQNQFIIKDEYIDELKHDRGLLEQEYLDMEKTGTEDLGVYFINKHAKLREDMEYFEKEFARLKKEFNQFLLQSLK